MANKITVKTTIAAPIEKVWSAWNNPEDIKQWNAASDDWHTTNSVVDLQVGGTFSSRMEAKDGSFGFDFAGKYTRIVEHELIESAFGDRTLTVEFGQGRDGVTVSETFDAEDTYSIEQQRDGWQSILNNFKKHVESQLPATHMLQPIPYLSFYGRCAEAMEFYAELFGGKIVSKMTFGEMPGDFPVPDDAKDRVVNEMLVLPGGAMLYGGDCPPGRPHVPMAGLMLALNFPTVDQAQKVFDGLAAEGNVTMPFAPAFWSEKFGMVTDKYGIHWGINGNLGVG